MWKIILIILAVLYALSPYDLLPDMILGWGWLDDLAILGFLWRYFYMQKRKREAFKKYYQHNQNTAGFGYEQRFDSRSKFDSDKNTDHYFSEQDFLFLEFQ